MTPDYKYKNMTLRPRWGEFVIENFLLLLLLPVAATAMLLIRHPLMWIVSLLTAIVITYLLYRYEYITSIKYHIGEEQLMIQHGIMSQRRDFVEMYRIVDYNETRTVIERMLGIKTVTVYSGDRTAPELQIKGIDSDLDLVYAIRERVEYNKLRKGVHELTNL